MAVDGSNTVNSASYTMNLFVIGKEIVTEAVLLDAATAGYTPAVGDLLVKREDDSNKHDRFDHQFASTKTTGSLTSATYTFSNTSRIKPESLKVYNSTAYATTALLSLGSQYSFDGAIPGTINVDVSGTAAITHSAAFSFSFVEEGSNQEILGVLYEIDQTDTANQTLRYATDCAVHYTALGTDGTATATTKVELKDRCRELNIEVKEG